MLKIEADRLHHQVTGSESYEIFSKRALGVLKSILNDHDEDIAVIAHGGIISTFVRDYLKLGEAEVGNCSILTLEVEDGNVDLLTLDGATVEGFKS